MQMGAGNLCSEKRKKKKNTKLHNFQATDKEKTEIHAQPENGLNEKSLRQNPLFLSKSVSSLNR
jgi:hypothetical protein